MIAIENLIFKKYFIVFICIGTSFVYSNTPEYQHKVSQFKMLTQQKKNIIMLGDSITGRGLWSELTQRSDIANRGIDRDTTDGVLARMHTLNNRKKQAFVMIGINDIAKDKSVKDIFVNYKKIIEKLQDKNTTPIIQSTLYVGKDNPHVWNKKVVKLNVLLREYATKKGIEYIDLNSKLAPNGILPKKHTSDSIHLNGEAYAIWIENIKKYFIKNNNK